MAGEKGKETGEMEALDQTFGLVVGSTPMRLGLDSLLVAVD